VLADATRRIAAMAAAQKVLYEEDQPTSFLAQDFLKSVCEVAKSTFSDRADIVVEEAPGSISNDMAMPLALIVNELLTNAVKYSGKTQGSGPIRVGLSSDGADYRLWVQDDGPGFEFTRTHRKGSSGLGLVEGLARQLGGSFSVERNGGARCSVSFPHKGVGLQ
jgi:two-component sensor histidine kinase